MPSCVDKVLNDITSEISKSKRTRTSYGSTQGMMTYNKARDDDIQQRVKQRIGLVSY